MAPKCLILLKKRSMRLARGKVRNRKRVWSFGWIWGHYRRDFWFGKAIDERISVAGLVWDQGFRIGIFSPGRKPRIVSVARRTVA
jgi:hypothetical protein